MRNAVWLRAGFPPFARLGLLTTATDVDRSYGVRVGGEAVFKVAGNDPAIASVLKGKVVEISSRRQAPYEIKDNELPEAFVRSSYASGVEYQWAQAFRTPPVGQGNLTSVDLPLRKVGTPTGNLSITIRADDGIGKPGTVIATADTLLDVSTLMTTVGWYTFIFAPIISLAANTLYHIAWDVTDLTHANSNYVRWSASNPNALPGTGSFSVNGGVDWTAQASYDCILRFDIDWLGFYPESLYPPWIGWIERPVYDAASGMVTVDCIDVAGMMGNRHSGLKSTRSGCAGQIARDLLFQANARNGFGLVWDTTSEAGTPISSIDVSGNSLLDALNQLADFTGDEWWIRTVVAHDNLELYLHWGRRQGFDLSQTVCLREGREVSTFAYSQDAIEETESVMVVGSGGAVEDRPAVVRATTGAERVNLPGAVVQQASESYRRGAAIVPALATERVVVAPLESDIKVLGELARNDLEQSPDTVETLSITVNERANWPDLAVGNIVRHRANTPWGALDRRIRIMESQPGDGTMELIVQVQNG